MKLKAIITWLFFTGFTLGLSQLTYANQTSDQQMEQAVLNKINKYRLSRGLSPLQMNPAIVQEARKHSRNMANHKVSFGHQHFMQRFRHLRSAIKNTSSGAENVAYNYKNADAVVSGWLKSSGHKRNIDGNYNLTGVGIERDKLGRIYFTQMFIGTGKRGPVKPKTIFSFLNR